MATEKKQPKSKKKDGITGIRLDLKSDIAQKLTTIADKDGRSRKNYCERLLIDNANNNTNE